MYTSRDPMDNRKVIVPLIIGSSLGYWWWTRKYKKLIPKPLDENSDTVVFEHDQVVKDLDYWKLHEEDDTEPEDIILPKLTEVPIGKQYFSVTPPPSPVQTKKNTSGQPLVSSTPIQFEWIIVEGDHFDII